MDLIIEKELSKYKTHIIDYATLKSILVNNGYTSIKDKIENLKQKGIIKILKKGLYIHSSPISNNIISKEIISNNLSGPSYITLDYALYFHGLIPETVHEITAVTTKRSKIFNTDYGVYSYKQIKSELFPFGIKTEQAKNGNFIIAGKEKALCDKIYLTRDIKITSKKLMIEFLENDLRIEFEEFNDFNSEILEKYYIISKSKKIDILLKTLRLP